MSRERIVITGIGVVSPFGDGIVPFWDAVKNGKNGIDKISLFDASELNCQVAAECKGFDPNLYMDPKEAKRFISDMEFVAKYESAINQLRSSPETAQELDR
jgi:3-oxoacyl-[acyl-carrier-protein] synthase II